MALSPRHCDSLWLSQHLQGRLPSLEVAPEKGHCQKVLSSRVASLGAALKKGLEVSY